MTATDLHSALWPDYIGAAFEGDSEVLAFYDRSVPVSCVADVCENVFQKLLSIEAELRFFGVTRNGEPVGYFAFRDTVLVSFGLNKACRQPAVLAAFFGEIKAVCYPFSCFLFSYNERAIRWLQKVGMTLIFNNVTLLQCP